MSAALSPESAAASSPAPSPASSRASSSASSRAKPGRRPHIIAFDLIRLIIMAFVVGVHTLAFGGGALTVTLGAITTVLHTSRELFFLLTTLVLVYNYGHRENTDWPGFWRRRYRLVIPAYLAWTAIYFCLDAPWHGSALSVLARLGLDVIDANARYHLYFLLVTMQVYALFPAIRWLLRRTEGYHGWLFGAACAYQLALSAAIQYGHPDWFTRGAADGIWAYSYVLYILGGAIAGWHFDRICEVTRRYANAVTVSAVACSGVLAGVGAYLAQVYPGGATTSAASAVFQPVVVVEALCFGWALLAGGLLWADRGAPARGFFAAGSASSFGIYLAHPLVLQLLLSLAASTGTLAAVRSSGPAAEPLILIGLFVPVVYAGAWIIASAARRTPLSLALTGREYRGRR